MRLTREFYQQDVLEVSRALLGKRLVRQFEGGKRFEELIVETEAYKGEEDEASHARFGRTKRSEVMYGKGGVVYVYLIYGMYWMLNVVAGRENKPQAVLIRGTKGVSGPGKLGEELELDRGFYGEDLVESERIWIEKGVEVGEEEIKKKERVGVDYAGKWAEKKWRFIW